jgi:tetratricopeptide (TPR) repeat protein
VQSDTAETSPKRPDGSIAKSATEYINLSLQHYLDGEWEKCVEAGIGALNINPSSAPAYNNICAAYLQLKDFDRAILACNKALALKPDFPLARGNLNAAIKQKESN